MGEPIMLSIWAQKARHGLEVVNQSALIAPETEHERSSGMQKAAILSYFRWKT
jgi:hypothetical protein